MSALNYLFKIFSIDTVHTQILLDSLATFKVLKLGRTQKTLSFNINNNACNAFKLQYTHRVMIILKIRSIKGLISHTNINYHKAKSNIDFQE